MSAEEAPTQYYFKGDSSGDIPALQIIRKGDKYRFSAWILNSEMAKNGVKVMDDKVVEQILRTARNKPLVHDPKTDDHPHITEGSLGDQLVYQKPFSVGTLETFNKEAKGYYVEGDMDEATAIAIKEGKIPPYVSPSVWKYDSDESSSRITGAEFLHLAIVKTPAWGKNLAKITGLCQGGPNECHNALKNVAAGSHITSLYAFIDGYKTGGVNSSFSSVKAKNIHNMSSTEGSTEGKSGADALSSIGNLTAQNLVAKVTELTKELQTKNSELATAKEDAAYKKKFEDLEKSIKEEKEKAERKVNIENLIAGSTFSGTDEDKTSLITGLVNSNVSLDAVKIMFPKKEEGKEGSGKNPPIAKGSDKDKDKKKPDKKDVPIESGSGSDSDSNDDLNGGVHTMADILFGRIY